MATARDDSYIWVTWITPLLSGDDHCEWKAWFKSHFTYEKRPSDFDQAKWKADHGEMVRSKVASLKNDGYTVYVEVQNKFILPGRVTTLAGAPDIVAIREPDALVIDCKTGQQRNADYFQVLVYMLVLPHTHHACNGRTLAGEVQYKNQTVRIEPEKLTDEVRQLVSSTLRRIGGDDPAPRVPSFSECRFCEITVGDCADRIDIEPSQRNPDHGLF